MFLDEAKIKVTAGSGGNGCCSIYRDRYSRQGRPDGGDGGRGGDVIIVADRHLQTLIDFKYKSIFKAERGTHGSSNNKKGRNGQSCIICVPCGTVIKDLQKNLLIRDLKEDREQVVVARGGEAGNGNIHKREATFGKEGKHCELRLELKLIADVGVIGFPNSGKSTLLSKLTGSHPKIANYPFTTKEPILGLLKLDGDNNIIIAEIPGLIKDAHKGKGLGDRFLKHTERTKTLVHLIDMAAVDGGNPVENYQTINNELKQYSEILAEKPKLIVANKMDIQGSQQNLKQFKKKVRKKIVQISAYTECGLDKLKDALKKSL